MKTETLTHKQKVKLEHLSQAAQVCNLLGWTWEQFTEHQFEQYLLFVDKICQGWPAVREEIQSSPVFRGFWINEWNQRVALDWLPMAIDNCEAEAYIMDEYLFVNNHIRLLNDEQFMVGYNHVCRMIRKGDKS